MHEAIRTDPEVEVVSELQVLVRQTRFVIPKNAAIWNITTNTVASEHPLLAMAPWCFVIIIFLFIEVWVVLQEPTQSSGEDLIKAIFVGFVIG